MGGPFLIWNSPSFFRTYAKCECRQLKICYEVAVTMLFSAFCSDGHLSMRRCIKRQCLYLHNSRRMRCSVVPAQELERYYPAHFTPSHLTPGSTSIQNKCFEPSRSLKTIYFVPPRTSFSTFLRHRWHHFHSVAKIEVIVPIFMAQLSHL